MAPPRMTPEAFWAKTARVGTCLQWMGHRLDGYGRVGWGRQYFRTHRLAWMLVYGPIPPGLFVCHHCDNRACIEPTHLFLGTVADNTADRLAKGRGPLGSLRGERQRSAKLTEDQVRHIRAAAAEGVAPRDLAGRFKVSMTCIHEAIRRHTWRHVA